MVETTAVVAAVVVAVAVTNLVVDTMVAGLAAAAMGRVPASMVVYAGCFGAAAVERWAVEEPSR